MTDLHEERIFAIEELLPAFLAQAQEEKHFFHGAHRKSDIHIVAAAHVALGVHKARLNEHQKTGFGQKNLLIDDQLHFPGGNQRKFVEIVHLRKLILGYGGVKGVVCFRLKVDHFVGVESVQHDFSPSKKR